MLEQRVKVEVKVNSCRLLCVLLRVARCFNSVQLDIM